MEVATRDTAEAVDDVVMRILPESSDWRYFN